jgi:hypothetical protein
MVHDRGHVTLLDLAAELPTEFVSPQFDHRVMGHSLNGAVESIKGDRNFSGFGEEPGEFFLKIDGVPLHGQPPVESSFRSPDHGVTDVLPQIRRVPLLTFASAWWKAQKLACTRRKLTPKSPLGRRTSFD